MSGTREHFLERARQAVAEGNRAGAVTQLPVRGQVGYQGAGPDPVARFVQEFTAVGGRAQVVPNGGLAVQAVSDILRGYAPGRVLLGRGAFVDTLDLEQAMRTEGYEVTPMDDHSGIVSRDTLFAADAGVSGVDYLIAETGTVVMGSRPDQPRALSLLPPVHIALAHRSQLLDDFFDLFKGDPWKGAELPPGLSLITGPSKTGDIELRLVTGVHGPGATHLILIDPGAKP